MRRRSFFPDTMRAQLLLVAIVASLACRDATKPEYTPSYSLDAYTLPTFNASPTDSISCQLFARWPATETIVAPWSGTVSVYATRVKRGARFFTGPVRTGLATLTLARGPGDSVRVTLTGAVNIAFDGRMSNANGDATGEWTCDAESSFGSHAAGEAHGSWRLGQELLID